MSRQYRRAHLKRGQSRAQVLRDMLQPDPLELAQDFHGHPATHGMGNDIDGRPTAPLGTFDQQLEKSNAGKGGGLLVTQASHQRCDGRPGKEDAHVSDKRYGPATETAGKAIAGN
nr:hypothetical protein [Peteryoungia desertarenae]